MNKNKTIFIIYACLLATIGLFSSDMYLPSLDTIRADFKTTPSVIGLSFSIYMFGFAIAQLFYGALSDQIGRKPPLLIGTLIFILGSVGCLLSPNIEIFLFFRFLQALGIGSAYVLWQPIIIDLFDEKESQKMFSLLMALSSLSPAIAPFLGGIISQEYGWHAVFWYISLHGALIFLWTQFGFKESLEKSRRKVFSLNNIIENYKYFISNRFFMLFNLAIACGLSLYLIFITLLPSMMADLGYTPKNIGLMFIPLAVTFIIGAEIGKRLFSRMGGQGVTQLGVIIVFLGASMLFIVTCVSHIGSAFLLISFFCVVTFGNGLLVPTGSAHLIGAFADKAGTCASIMGFITSLLAVFTTSLASLFISYIGIYAMSGTIIIFAIIMLLSFYGSRPRVQINYQ